MNLYLALDVGGTKSAAVLADDHQILARTTAGSIKTLRISPEEASTNLKVLQDALEAQAGIPLRGNIVRTCVGTSGISAPTVRHWLRGAFAQAVGGEFVLLGDEVIALDAAFAGRRGVLAIAGTGSNIVGRASTGEMAHTGGWGPALADEGSGHWIGTEALRACFRAIDAASPSSADAVSAIGKPFTVQLPDLPPLLRAILSALELPGLDSIIGAANAPGFNSSVLVPTVVEAASGGDLLAQQVLRRAGEDLAGLITSVIRKVEHFEQSVGSDPAENRLAAPPVAFVGGVLTHIALVRDAMHASLRATFGAIELAGKPVDPLDGALWHARGRPALAS
jgi:N-acetylglucosamine kinase-like BadF-type ATPase